MRMAPHSFRPPPRTRPPRFVVNSAADESSTGGSLRSMISASAAQRGERSQVLEQTERELASFMEALATVESAGRSLHSLPRERLEQIQSVLTAGVPSVLPPVRAAQPAANPSRWSRTWRDRFSRGPRAAAPRSAAVDDDMADHDEPAAPAAKLGLSASQLQLLRCYQFGAAEAEAAAPGAAADARPQPAAGRSGASLPAPPATPGPNPEGEVEVEVCAICLGELGEGEQVCALSCRHVFHHGCVSRWLQVATTCPLCKTDALGRVDAGEDGHGGAGAGSAEEEAFLINAAASAIAASMAASASVAAVTPARETTAAATESPGAPTPSGDVSESLASWRRGAALSRFFGSSNPPTGPRHPEHLAAGGRAAAAAARFAPPRGSLAGESGGLVVRVMSSAMAGRGGAVVAPLPPAAAPGAGMRGGGLVTRGGAGARLGHLGQRAGRGHALVPTAAGRSLLRAAGGREGPRARRPAPSGGLDV